MLLISKQKRDYKKKIPVLPRYAGVREKQYPAVVNTYLASSHRTLVVVAGPLKKNNGVKNDEHSHRCSPCTP